MVDTVDLVESITKGIDFPGGAVKPALRTKYIEADAKFKGSISRWGNKLPIEIAFSKTDVILGNGGHRLAVAYHRGMPEVYVKFVEIGNNAPWAWEYCHDDSCSEKYVSSDGRRTPG